MKAKLIFWCILMVFTSCSTSKIKATPEQIETLNQLTESRSFSIESEWALPFVTNGMIAVQNSGLLAPGDTANRISLVDNANVLKLKGETITSDLPYFGEVQMPSGYMGSEDNRIVFDGTVKDYRVMQNKDNSYTVKFDAKSYNENFIVTIILFPNLKSTMTLRGANRFPIQYSGTVRPLKE